MAPLRRPASSPATTDETYEDGGSLHVVYEHGAYGFGLRFDREGRLLGALNPTDVARSRHRSPAPTLLDPKRRQTFHQAGAAAAVQRFNRYFARTFREHSPLSDSSLLIGDLLSEWIRHINLSGPILDLGAGSGESATGSPDGLIHLDSSPPRCRASVTVGPSRVCATGEALPFADATFGGVLCLFVLEHVADPFPLLQEISRVLRPNGRALLAVPSTRPLELLRWLIPGLRPTLPIHHLRTFGPFRMKAVESTPRVLAALSAAGCREVVLAPLNQPSRYLRLRNERLRSIWISSTSPQTAILIRR